MTRNFPALGALAAGLLVYSAASAIAASGDDLTAIRSEMDAMRQEYQSKIIALEKRLRRAEAKNATQAPNTNPPATAQTAQAAPAASVPDTAPVSRAPVSASAFNPSISVILNGSFASIENEPGSARVPGFVLGDEAGLPDRGFSLGESEVSISASVDQEFVAHLIFALGGDDSVGVEEAYIQTTNLPWGLTARAGWFFSGIGYLNEKHAHAWDFEDAPLPYRVMLGNQYGDDGVQMRWIAPTEIFVEFGAEWFRGDAFPAGGADDSGAGTVTAFVHTGDDIGEESSFLAGLSYLRTKADGRDTGGDIFTGTDNLGIASLVYKWAPHGNPAVTNLVLSGEYFFGHEQGEFNGMPVDIDRSGFYIQGVYQFMPRWRAGVRYAEIDTSDPGILLAGSVLDAMGHTPQAATAMLEYDTSEFGRFRLQYTHDRSDFDPNNEWVAQYTVSIGPHGAHRF
jgi:hypothetical protein